MKIIIIAMMLCGSCMANDLYLVPSVVYSADTFMADGQIYKIDGIQPPTGAWNKIATAVMEKMIKGKEFKFLYFPPKNSGKKVKIKHVYFGIYGRDGKPQSNASIKLLQMGLAKFSRGSVDENRGKPYPLAEKHAKANKLGIWGE